MVLIVCVGIYGGDCCVVIFGLGIYVDGYVVLCVVDFDLCGGCVWCL